MLTKSSQFNCAGALADWEPTWLSVESFAAWTSTWFADKLPYNVTEVLVVCGQSANPPNHFVVAENNAVNAQFVA